MGNPGDSDSVMHRVEDRQPWDSNSDVQGGGWATLGF